MITEFVGDYRFLSNFYPAPIFLYGYLFPSAENAYQAAKVNYQELGRTLIMMNEFTTIAPDDAKKLGRKIALLPDVWDSAKVDIMRLVLRKKFEIPCLRQLLEETERKELIEGNRWDDAYWGKVITTGGMVGENVLGQLLMELREEYST